MSDSGLITVLPHSKTHAKLAIRLPGENRIEQNLRRLRLHRLAEAKRLREADSRDLSRGRTGKARLTLLRALALDPFDRDTLEDLRALERRVSDRQMTAKIARSRETLDFRRAESPGSSIPDNTDRGHAAPTYPANELDNLSTQPPGHSARQKELVELHLRRASDRFEQRGFDAALQEITRAEAIAANDPDLEKVCTYSMKNPRKSCMQAASGWPPATRTRRGNCCVRPCALNPGMPRRRSGSGD